MTGTRGLEFLLDLENAVALRGGDALVLDDDRLIEVVAAAEPLVEIRGADPHHLVRVAWHLGNRHLPTQIMPKGLRIRRDHVIEAMVKGLGARVIEIEAPFDPEGGAYAGAPWHATTCIAIRPRSFAHDHSSHDHHDHDHDHHHHDEHCDHDHHTAIPMLMTTSKPPPADDPRRRLDGRRGGGAVPADDLAVAGLSGRRLLLFQRHRMGGGGRRYRRCRLLARLARGDARRRIGVLRRRVSGARASGRPACDDAALRDIAELAAAFVPSRERQLETSAQGRAFIEIARAAWSCNGLDALSRLADGPIVYPVAVGVVSAAHAIPLAPAMHAFLHALVVELDIRRRAAGAARANRQPARARSARAGGRCDRESARSGLARRSRQRDLPRRSRQPAPRNAVHKVVPVMNVTHAPSVVPAKAGTHNHQCPWLCPAVGSQRSK